MFILIVVLLGLFLQRWVLWLPALIVVPLILSHTLDGPFGYLLLLGLAAELFTLLPIGVTLLLFLLPLLLARLVSRSVDISLAYWLTLLASSVLSCLLWFGVPIALSSQGLTGREWGVAMATMYPWGQIAAIGWSVSLFCLAATVLIRFNWQHN